MNKDMISASKAILISCLKCPYMYPYIIRKLDEAANKEYFMDKKAGDGLWIFLQT